MRDQERNRDRIRELSKCNHYNKNHPPPCHLLSHPDCNPDAGIPFAESEKGKEWLKKGHYCVSNCQRLDGSVIQNHNTAIITDNRITTVVDIMVNVVIMITIEISTEVEEDFN